MFFVTLEAHPSLVSVLPDVLSETRKHVGERRLTVVFDRGGWSPKLFEKMVADGFDVLTYRKGKPATAVPNDEFKTYKVPTPTGEVVYELHDGEVKIGEKLTMRQVTRRQGDHQTQIVTTRRDLDVVGVAVRMFRRWRQENFFKYMLQEYALDGLVDYGKEAADPARTVPNPAYKKLDRQLRDARKKLRNLEAKYGSAALDNPEAERPTMRGFKIAHGTEIGIPLRAARARVEALIEERKQVPKRVPVGEIVVDVVRLRTVRKRLADGFKIIAYQVESSLVSAVAPHYNRSVHEGRRLILAALQSAADIKLGDNRLYVTLAPQSSQHRTQAVAELCKLLNETKTNFPGTSRRMVYAIRGTDSDK